MYGYLGKLKGDFPHPEPTSCHKGTIHTIHDQGRLWVSSPTIFSRSEQPENPEIKGRMLGAE
jgi:hypothetical protein